MVLAGAAVLLLGAGWKKCAAGVGAALVLFGLWALVSRDGWAKLFSLQLPAGETGRISLTSAASFVALGAGIFWVLVVPRMRHLPGLIAVAVLAAAVFSLMGDLSVWLTDFVWIGRPGMSTPAACGIALAAWALWDWCRTQTPRAERASLVSLALFSAAGVAAVDAAAVAYVGHQQLAFISRRVVHTHEVRGAVDNLVSEVARMESSARGYALTGVTSFRSRVSDHRDAMRADLERLQSLVASNAAQARRTERMRALAAQKIAAAEEMVRVRDEGGQDAAQALLMQQPTASGSALVNLADEMRAEETRLLRQREEEWVRTEASSRIVQVLGGGVAIALVVLAFVLANRAGAARRRAEKESQEARERLETIFAATDDGLVLQGENGQVISCNDAACRILGLTREQLTGRDSLDPRWGTIYEDGRPWPGSEHPAPTALRTKTAQRGVIQGITRADGSLIWIRISSVPIIDAQGNARRVVTSFSDVTSRLELEAELRESGERLRLATESAGVGVWEWDVTKNTIVWDARMFAIYGIDAAPGGTVQYRDWASAVLPEDLARQEEVLQEAARVGRTSEREFRIRRRRDGAVRVIHAAETVRRDRFGKVERVVGVNLDITDQKQLFEQIERARDAAVETSRLKSQFLANMSHEIRTPMNGIIGMTDLLLGTTLEQGQREMAEVVQKSAESLLQIVNDVLDFSKIEAGKLHVETREFDLRQLVEATVGLFAPRGTAKGVRVTWAFAPETPPLVRGDAVRVRQVLTNLVSNAVKFTDAGEVSVVVSALPRTSERTRWRFEVRDTGPGIPREEQARLFQAFVQVDGSSTRRHGGTGLGLAISQQLVQLMDGSIGVVSEAGRGSVFWFELDLERALGRPALAAEPVARAARAEAVVGRRFLLVEDNQANQLVAAALLEQLGHTCTLANDGVEALRELAAQSFDGVLMDCQMPGMDGYTATRQIRAGAVPGKEKIPIIALTAYAMPDDQAKCRAAGMDDYLSKPVRLADLGAALSRCGFESRLDFSPAAADIAPAAPVLDAQQVAQLRLMPGRRHRDMMVELAVMFREITPGIVSELEKAVGASDGATTELLAHRLAGSAAHLGAFALRHTALDLEAAARRADWGAVRSGFRQLRSGAESVYEALRVFLP
jgi:PAS domain S-box-containing protein